MISRPKSKVWCLSDWRKRRKAYIKDKSCEFCGSKEHLVIHHPQRKNTLTDEKYQSFEGTKILCNRCHLALHKGMTLCPICKKKYKKARFPTCFACRSNKEPVEKEEDTYIEYKMPCENFVTILKEKVENEFFTPIEACLHYCGSPEIQGDINNCSDFLWWYAIDNEKKNKPQRHLTVNVH